MRKKTRRILIIIMAVILAFVCFFLYSTTGKRSDIKERNEIKATLMKKVRANILPFPPALFARKSSEAALRANILWFFHDLFAHLLPIR